MDRKGGSKMVDEISVLAQDIIKTIEKEDAFIEAKEQGGFLKKFKAKNVMEFLDETWNIN